MNCVLLLANYRTGSSSYSHVLTQNKSIPWFPEPHLDKSKYQDCKIQFQNNEKFVIKFMPDQIEDHELYQKILASDCYKIKLTRENKIEQIASYYIALMTGVWNDHLNEYARGNKYTVDISMEKIKTSIEIITKNDRLLETIDIKFDQELTYESLADAGTLTSGTLKLPPPKNYTIIKQLIEHEHNKSR